MEKLTHGSLFSGIGGFDLAAEWMGWENKFHCEWNEFGKRVLNYYWPQAISYGDITKTDFTIWRGRIDILTGGFPCQPYSTAGKRLGKEDERHLWPHMLRAIREIRPRYVVGENVYGIINWNGGLVFDEVQSDLEAEGYAVQAVVLPAASVNAPHKRDRTWFVAYRTNTRVENMQQRRENGVYEFGATSDATRKQSERVGFEQRKVSESQQGEFRGDRCKMDNNRNASDTSSTGREKLNLPGFSNGEGHSCRCSNAHRTNWQDFPTQSPVCTGDDGLPGRLDGITFSKWRSESIKAAGNAIVPQVALELFKVISRHDELMKYT